MLFATSSAIPDSSQGSCENGWAVSTASGVATPSEPSVLVSRIRPSGSSQSTTRIMRMGWGIGDQALSSFTNFAVAVMVAHESSPRTFGLFALLFAAYCVVLGICRAVCSEPLTVRFTNVSAVAWHNGTALATGSAVLIGLISSLVCVIIGIFCGTWYGGLIAIFGLAMPALLLQDTWRFAFSTAGRSRAAFCQRRVLRGRPCPYTRVSRAKAQCQRERSRCCVGNSSTCGGRPGRPTGTPTSSSSPSAHVVASTIRSRSALRH